MYIVEGPKDLNGKHYGHIFVDGKAFVEKHIWKSIFQKLGFKVTQASPDDNIKKILIIHHNVGCGDMLFITPAIKGLKEKYPGVRIEVYGTVPSVYMLAHNPYVDRLVAGFPSKYILAIVDEYDEVFDTSDFIRQDIASEVTNIYDLYCRRLNVNPSTKRPIAGVSKEEKEAIKEQLLILGVDPEKDKIAVIQTNSTSAVRTWPLPNSAQLARELAKKGYKVIFTGTYTEIFQSYFSESFGDTQGIISLIGALDIRALIALISVSDLVVGPDSAGYHIAEALGVTNIPIFSSFDPYIRMKNYKHCYPVYKPYKCGPCFCHTPDCPTKMNKPNLLDVAYCMATITVDDVMKVIDKAEKGEKIEIKSPDKIFKKNCPICNSKNKSFVSRKNNVYYHKCFDCGTIYADRFVNGRKDSYKALSECKDPIEVLKKLKLKKVVIDVPDADLIRDNTSPYLNGDFCGEYVTLFTEKSIEKLAKKTGFSIKDINKSNGMIRAQLQRDK